MIFGNNKKFSFRDSWIKDLNLGLSEVAFIYLSLLIFGLIALFFKKYLAIFIVIWAAIIMTVVIWKAVKQLGVYQRIYRFFSSGQEYEVRDWFSPVKRREATRELVLINHQIPEPIYTKIYLDKQKKEVLSYNYCRLFASLYFGSKLRKALVLGGAGCSVPLVLVRNFKSAQVDVVEIDSKMIDVAIKFFLRDTERIKFFNEDAREFLKRDSQKYDLIFCDLFTGIEVNDFVFSKPFLDKMKSRLKGSGILIINAGRVPLAIPLVINVFLPILRQIFRNTEVFYIYRSVVFLVTFDSWDSAKKRLLGRTKRVRFRKEIERLISESWLDI